MHLALSNPTDTLKAGVFFCGAGGLTQGFTRAGVEVVAAFNHDYWAIETHAANHPDAFHGQVDLMEVDVLRMPAWDLLFASPCCQNHSQANSKKLYERGDAAQLEDDYEQEEWERVYKSERSRVTMVAPLRYAFHKRPKFVVLENVCEAMKWGADRDGSMMLWYLQEWTNIGYTPQACFLNSQFFHLPDSQQFGCQSRDRMYLVFTRNDVPLPDLEHRPESWCGHCEQWVEAYQKFRKAKGSWPVAAALVGGRFGKWGLQYDYHCSVCHKVMIPHRYGAIASIDVSDVGERIGDRARKLSPNTYKRLQIGIDRYWDDGAFSFPATDYATSASLNMPHPTLTTRRDRAIVQTPGFVYVKAGNTFEREGSTCRSRGLDEPMWTMSTTDAFGLLQFPNPPVLWCKNNGAGDGANYCHHVSQPVGTITAKDVTTLLGMPWLDQYYGNRPRPLDVKDPLPTLPTHDRFSVVHPGRKPEVDECFMRWLTENEMSGLMGFRGDYILKGGNRTRNVRLLGDAVTPPVASWITERCVAAMREDKTPTL